MTKPVHFYASPDSTPPRDTRWFVCQYERDDNVCETFEHEGRSARENAERIAGALNIVTRLHALLDGTEWDSETMSEVATLMWEGGFPLRAPNEVEACDECECLVPTNKPFEGIHHSRRCSHYRENNNG